MNVKDATELDATEFDLERLEQSALVQRLRRMKLPSPPAGVKQQSLERFLVRGGLVRTQR